ncbi:TetR/AcrR family transcriptional regulator [Vallitalea pronyensis]|uniref:TetR/AcrR family transcriptional regulator n=1 Tax=Vallitalea pronyensis TaxID=1348613 RepID=A0A8J8MIY8_9FIRM|nr:TetR/AcrR family transcriptional regulator [Vallitalea pronyensis]QUI22371.1 TetR/AcrR family transcriptional regulator [Vallitalea pronyensis]
MKVTKVVMLKIQEVIGLENTFRTLDDEKKRRIINSALEEFSLNKYEKASTNAIVKNAGISKGSLFQYFANKQALYDYLGAFTIEVMLEAIQKEMGFRERDLFERIRKIALIKIGVAAEYPYIIPFSKVMYEQISVDEIKKKVEAEYPNIYENMYFKNIDFGLFKEDMDIHKSIEIVQWTLERIMDDYMKDILARDKAINMEELRLLIDSYLSTLKKAFYK